MIIHLYVHQNHKHPHTYRLYQKTTLRSIPPHLELERVAADCVQISILIEAESGFLVKLTVVVVPREAVDGGDAGERGRIVIRAGPDLHDDVVGEGVL